MTKIALLLTPNKCGQFKELHFTILKTYVIPMEISEKLNYYSKMFGVKKLHLIIFSCEIFEKEDDDKINQKMKELIYVDSNI